MSHYYLHTGQKSIEMRLTIILVAPARAENIGAAARAMKTMGFTQLRIVDSEAHLEPATRWGRMARVILLIILTFFQR